MAHRLEKQLQELQQREQEDRRIKVLQKKIVDLVLEFMAGESRGVTFNFLATALIGAQAELAGLPLEFLKTLATDDPESP